MRGRDCLCHSVHECEDQIRIVWLFPKPPHRCDEVLQFRRLSPDQRVIHAQGEGRRFRMGIKECDYRRSRVFGHITAGNVRVPELRTYTRRLESDALQKREKLRAARVEGGWEDIPKVVGKWKRRGELI